jgi:hypothetical protein
MNRRTKELFSHTCYGIPRQKRGHIPTIEERGQRMRLVCSCGYHHPSVTWGNRAGWAYGIAAMFFHYQSHANPKRIP